MFSIELNSNDHVRLTSLNGDRTVIEGSLGEMSGLSFVEGVFLEVQGNYGTLRVDLTETELKRLLFNEVKKEVT